MDNRDNNVREQLETLNADFLKWTEELRDFGFYFMTATGFGLTGLSFTTIFIDNTGLHINLGLYVSVAFLSFFILKYGVTKLDGANRYVRGALCLSGACGVLGVVLTASLYVVHPYIWIGVTVVSLVGTILSVGRRLRDDMIEFDKLNTLLKAPEYEAPEYQPPVDQDPVDQDLVEV